MIWNEVVCLGDSLTYGARDEFGLSFPVELSRKLEEQTGEFYVCHNYGINGDTSSDLCRRAWNDIGRHNDSKILTIMVGTNDTKLPIPTNIYKKNLEYLVKIGKIFKKNIFMALLPELGFSPHYFNNKNYISEYNKVIENVAEEHGCYVVDMTTVGKFYVDGVHFSNDGYKEMAKRWCEAICGK